MREIVRLWSFNIAHSIMIFLRQDNPLMTTTSAQKAYYLNPRRTYTMPSHAFALLLFLGLAVFSPSAIQAQESDAAADLLRLDVSDMYEDLSDGDLNMQVTIASKRSESIFDAPFSVSVITYEDIRRSGATSLMEAFRLVPGLLVFEQTNGNFDIHLRGGNNVQLNTIFSRSSNTTTLVMIDNRPTYSYYQGGTFWETLPIDINDIDRIELVRGASSAMYGPNAVSGVINIITRKPKDRGSYVVVNMQEGNNETSIVNGSLGYRFNKKLSFIVSANSQHRDRDQDTYFTYGPTGNINDYVPLEDLSLAPSYPEASIAMEKYGINAFLNYKPSANTEVDFSIGWQDSRVQKVYSENLLAPLNTSDSRSYYMDLNVQFKNLSTKVSYAQGTRTEGLDSNVGLKWDFANLDIVTEYEMTFGNLRILPGLNFRTALFDDTPYFDASTRAGFLNEQESISNFAPFLRADYTIMQDRLRLFAAIRLDQFNFPKDLYLAYQLGGHFKLNESNALRLNIAQANRAPSIIDVHVDRLLSLGPDTQLLVLGNKEIKLLTSTMYELGYRSKLSENVQLDIEAFFNNRKNYSDFINLPADINTNDPSISVLSQKTLNTPLNTRQWGVTASLNYNHLKWSVKPYLSFQYTLLRNASLYPNTADAPPTPGNNNNPEEFNLNTANGTSVTHSGTPNFYGGIVVNYLPSERWELNMNAYFYGSQDYLYFINSFLNNGTSGIGSVQSKLLINARIGYKPMQDLSVFLNFRNLMDNQANEFFFTDKIGFKALAGLNFEF